MSVRKILQTETRDLHLGLHELPVFRDLLGQRLSIERYRSLIQRLYGFYLPLDGLLSKGVARLPDDMRPGPYRERAPLLRHDLIRLCGDAGDHGRLPRCDVLPRYPEDGNVLGGLYVVEGSLLGGRILNRKLDHLFGPDNAEGRCFFSWCAAQDGRRWTALCEEIDRHGDGLGGVEAMVDAAKQTFAAMLTWMKGESRQAPPIRHTVLPAVSGHA